MRAALAPAVSLPLVLLAFGCTEGKGGVEATGSKELHVDPPARIVFAEARVGGPQEQYALVTLRNDGAQVVTIESVWLTENDLHPELSLSFGARADLGVEEMCAGPGGFLLAPEGAPGSVCHLFVLYRPMDAERDWGELSIRSDDDTAEDGVWRVAVETMGGRPQVVVDPPGEVLFEDVLPGQTAEREVSVRNVGTVELTVTGLELTNTAAGDFSVEYGERSAYDSLPATLAPQEPGDEIVLVVRYAPARPGRDLATLRVRSDDPQRPTMLIDLRGVTRARCVQVAPLDVDFGETLVGGREERQVDVTNCGDTDLLVRSLGFVEGSNPAFSVLTALEGLDAGCLAPGALAPCAGEAVLAPNTTAPILLGYAPPAEGVSGGRLALETDVPGRERVELALYGRGTHDQRPEAVCEARLLHADDWNAYPDADHAFRSIPLKVIELRGSGSFDPDGPVNHHKWALVEAPETSNARLFPSDSQADPTFAPDVAGVYVLELEVVDSRGQSSSPNCQVHLDVVADGDIHVELTWHTPADADELDTGYGAGTDVDLHLLHPLGDWLCSPRDCFFSNPHPDWGDPQAEDDDPTLDIDDTDGAGPENITLERAELQRVYRVGVHYFDDHGYGPSFARVRIYIGGVLRYEKANIRLAATDAFSDVAAIAWPSGVITPIGRTELQPPEGACP